MLKGELKLENIIDKVLEAGRKLEYDKQNKNEDLYLEGHHYRNTNQTKANKKC